MERENWAEQEKTDSSQNGNRKFLSNRLADQLIGFSYWEAIFIPLNCKGCLGGCSRLLFGP